MLACHSESAIFLADEESLLCESQEKERFIVAHPRARACPGAIQTLHSVTHQRASTLLGAFLGKPRDIVSPSVVKVVIQEHRWKQAQFEASGDLPIHDRWWITQGHGLRMGTSFNSLGGKRESEISILADHEIVQREQEIDEFLNFRKREHNGERLNIHAFSISIRA